MQLAITRVIVCCRRIVPRYYANIVALKDTADIAHHHPSLKLTKFEASKLLFSGTLRLKRHSFCTAAMDPKVEELMNDPNRHYDYETLQAKRKDRAVIVIDVRQPEELAATGIIPDSINIPLGELDQALGNLPEEEFQVKYHARKPGKSDHLVFSCQAGRRSLLALSTAFSRGFLNSANYRGGWIDWEKNASQPAK